MTDLEPDSDPDALLFRLFNFHHFLASNLTTRPPPQTVLYGSISLRPAERLLRFSRKISTSTMGWDYALVHIKYTIPPCLCLTLLYRPIFSALDLYKTLFLITIAVVSTIPWDSYLIRHDVWSYPPGAVLGPTLYAIPAEELFFFVIQTYGVCLLYMCCNRPNFNAVYLPHGKATLGSRSLGVLIQLLLVSGISAAVRTIQHGGVGTYMGLILAWALPFLLLLWSLSYRFMLNLPSSSLVIPIGIPTLYLWIVDTFALRRGTWSISSGTKLGIYVWPGLELEEAVFFAATNTLIVFGLCAFDHAVSILHTFPERFSHSSKLPSPLLAVRALLSAGTRSDDERIEGLKEAISRLQNKSRSFFFASSAFEGPLRADLIILYSFCRVADDLIDGSKSVEEAKSWIGKLRTYLDLSFCEVKDGSVKRSVFIHENFPSGVQTALLQLQCDRLSPAPLYDLLKGFEMDLNFFNPRDRTTKSTWPIETEIDLIQYGKYVAGTVGELCLDLLIHHYPEVGISDKKNDLRQAAVDMGVVLQTINIARDIQVDSEMGRVYIPNTWLQQSGMTPEDIIAKPLNSATARFRTMLLDKAFGFYEKALPVLCNLPREVAGPMRMVVESYVEIGRTLRDEGTVVRPGKATVTKTRRFFVAWKALNGW